MNYESVDGEEGYTPLNFENFYGQELKTEDVGSFTPAEFEKMNPCDCDMYSLGDLPKMETVLTISPQVDRFNLEDEILRCWNLSEELGVLNEAVLESDITKDDISNILVGLQKLYELKFDKLWQTFEAMIKNGNL